jgi:hypothetical protein
MAACSNVRRALTLTNSLRAAGRRINLPLRRAKRLERLNRMPDSTLRSPALASLLRRRRLAVVISGIALLQTALVRAGLPSWPCPVAHTLGLPCPGCGLTRAAIALLKGDWRTAFALHAYAPMLLLALALCGCASLLPARPRERFVNGVAAIERRTGVTAFLLIGLIGYWLARLLFVPSAFARILAN